MSERVLEDFERFFVELPATVRGDLSCMMVMLSDENLIVDDIESVCEAAARGLFDARTRIGRIANLINAVSIIDVYFALDVGKRSFLGKNTRPRSSSTNPNISLNLDCYCAQVQAVRHAKQRWQTLRQTGLTSEAIANALIPSRAGSRVTAAVRRKPSDDRRRDIRHGGRS